MWCDNCLLLFPLRVGAMVWAFFIMLYSVAGSIFLFKWGEFFYFVYPEWDIYGGIGMAVGLLCLITLFALGNRSYIWTRAVKFLWPFVIVICGVRAILMIVELQRGKDNIQWECDNGGVLWTDADSTTTDATDSGTIPAGFCSTGFANLYAAFIVALLVDLGFQMYMFFMVWRYQKRLEHYQNMKGPFAGGYYA